MGMESEKTNVITFGSTCQYKLATYIARGGFGIVRIASISDRGDYTGKDTVAVKTVHVVSGTAVTNDVVKWGKMVQRLKKLIVLKHDHLADYHKISITHESGGPIIELVMDYYEDGDLASMLSSQKQQNAFLDESAVICYTMQMAEGVGFLHRSKIIHGDLKPANVLVRRNENGHYTLMIGDLDDIVVMEQNFTTSADISKQRGTVRYMSPEMLQELMKGMAVSPLGRKTDIWSLGCIIHDLINCCFGIRERALAKTNESFLSDHFIINDDTSNNRFIEKITDGYVPIVNGSVPVVFSELVQRCLFHSSVHRPSAEQLICTMNEIVKQKQKGNSLSSPIFEAARDCACGKGVRNYTAGNQEILLKWEKENVILCAHQFRQPTGTVTLRVEMYEPLTNTLKEIKLPKQNASFTLSSPFLIKTQLFCHIESSNEATTQFRVFDCVSRTWLQNPISADFKMFNNAGRFPPVVIGNKVYFWDGRENRHQLKVAEIFDDKIRHIQELPDPGYFAKSDVWIMTPQHKHKILVLGSERFRSASSIPTELARAFDTETGKWDPLSIIPELPRHRDCAFVALGDDLYTMGGYSTDDHEFPSQTCVRLNPTLKWQFEMLNSRLQKPRGRHGAFVVNNCIYVFGGGVPVGMDHGLSSTMEVFSPESDTTWSEYSFTNIDKKDFNPDVPAYTSCFPFKS